MAFNAFQGGQMFALQQLQREQNIDAEAARQRGRNALAEQFGEGALDPNAFSTVTGADRAERRLASDIDQRGVANERNAALDAERRAETQRRAERQATQDAQAQEEQERQRQIEATGNLVRFYKAGLANGATPEEITQRAAPALAALGVSPEEIGQLPQMIANDPAVLDELEAAIMTTKQDQAAQRLALEQQRLAQGGTRLAQGDRRLDQQEPEFQGRVAGSKKGEQLTAERVDTSLTKAREAEVAIDNIERQKELIDQGIRTGSLSEARQGAARFFADILGIPDEEVATTDEFFARAGAEVAQQIQAFGAGTGLSDADREFARKIVGGEQTLDIEAIKRLIDMRLKVNRKTIADYNRDRDAFTRGSPRMQDIFPRIGGAQPASSGAVRRRFNPETGQLEEVGG